MCRVLGALIAETSPLATLSECACMCHWQMETVDFFLDFFFAAMVLKEFDDDTRNVSEGTISANGEVVSHCLRIRPVVSCSRRLGRCLRQSHWNSESLRRAAAEPGRSPQHLPVWQTRFLPMMPQQCRPLQHWPRPGMQTWSFLTQRRASWAHDGSARAVAFRPGGKEIGDRGGGGSAYRALGRARLGGGQGEDACRAAWRRLLWGGGDEGAWLGDAWRGR